MDRNQNTDRGEWDTLKGKTKDVVGSATGDSNMEAEGKLDQIKGKVKEGVADIKDRLDQNQEQTSR